MSDQQNQVSRAERRQELEQTSFSANQQGGALMQPTNGKELMDMANMMSASGQMVRDFYRGNPGDCAALIMICQPYGFNPFMVSWKTYKASKSADAPVSFEGQLVNAMVNQSAPVRGRLKYTYEGEGPERTCTVTGIDRETGDTIEYTSPPIKSIPIKNSPLWKADPDQQLGYYSARSWARRHFPELLLGVYTREEIESAPPRDVTPQPSGFAQKAMDARKQAQEAPAPDIEDAVEVEPTSGDDGQAGHWTDDHNLDEAFAGSESWQMGEQAHADGQPRTSCPFTPDDDQSSLKAADWLAAWDLSEETKPQKGTDQ